MSQCNSIASGLSNVFRVPPPATGLATAVLLGAVMLGGLKLISRVTEALFPFMALFYICLLYTSRDLRACAARLPPVFGRYPAAGRGPFRR